MKVDLQDCLLACNLSVDLGQPFLQFVEVNETEYACILQRFTVQSACLKVMEMLGTCDSNTGWLCTLVCFSVFFFFFPPPLW